MAIDLVIQAIPWLLTAMSLYGTHLNAHRDRRCFSVWIVANACYCGWFMAHALWPQALLFAVFIHYNLVGLREW